MFNKHATNLWHVIKIIHKELLEMIGSWDLFLTDGFPVPVCHYARARTSTLFKDKVGFSYCAAKQEGYYGFKVLSVTTESGIPVGYVIDKANLPNNSTVIGDKGFIGEEFSANLLFYSLKLIS